MPVQIYIIYPFRCHLYEGSTNRSKVDYGKPHEMDALEKLMMKQTILVFIVVVSTWCSLGLSIVDGKFSLFLGVDSMVNTIASLFVFKYTNKFWNGCLHCCRCYCCYNCCMAFCGCFPCDGEDGCCACCLCCDDMMQRMGSSVKRMSLRGSSSSSDAGMDTEKKLGNMLDDDEKQDKQLTMNTRANSFSTIDDNSVYAPSNLTNRAFSPSKTKSYASRSYIPKSNNNKTMKSKLKIAQNSMDDHQIP